MMLFSSSFKNACLVLYLAHTRCPLNTLRRCGKLSLLLICLLYLCAQNAFYLLQKKYCNSVREISEP